MQTQANRGRSLTTRLRRSEEIVLRELRAAPGGLTVRELQVRTGLSYTVVYKACRRLVELALLTRRRELAAGGGYVYRILGSSRGGIGLVSDRRSTLPGPELALGASASSASSGGGS